MIFWILAATVTLISLVALYYASVTDAVNARDGAGDTATTDHFRVRLAEIEESVAAERLTSTEAEAARGELARELVRLNKEQAKASPTSRKGLNYIAFGAISFVAIASFVVYAQLGKPALPAQPLAGREFPVMDNIDVVEAIARVEAALAANPDDVRGWAVIAPIYMQSGRFADAVNAYRRVMELLPPSADAETDLAEALMMANNGSAAGEPLALLESAAARDPQHIRSRFYLAGEATRAGEFEKALQQWKALLALGTGDEPWADIARRGLEAAEAGLRGEPVPAALNALSTDPDQQQMIRDMVEGLSERLMADGGSIDEWTRLVRSRLVLGELDGAQAAYDAAKTAFPEAELRLELDAMAAEAGLE